MTCRLMLLPGHPKTCKARQALIEENERLREEAPSCSRRMGTAAVCRGRGREAGACGSLPGVVAEARPRRFWSPNCWRWNWNPLRRTMVIDKGKRQGAYNGQPVADAR
ncbi:MAG: hypothetical protein U5P41_04805, partial [Gammaproteobacteria bacterium]|nr:hypothetical protein [Gammaproteobacteria bacterium]